jgi:hypothetical protein
MNTEMIKAAIAALQDVAAMFRAIAELAQTATAALKADLEKHK